MAGSLAAPWLAVPARLAAPPRRLHRLRGAPRRLNASWSVAYGPDDALPPPLPAESVHLSAFSAADFELVGQLGELSYRSVSAASPTLSWTVLDEGGAPDALRVATPRLAGLMSGSDDTVAAPDAGYAGGVPPVAAVRLYAARFVGGPGPPAPVLLKEHLRGAEAVARRELAAYHALASPPALMPGAPRPRPFALRAMPRQDETDPPLAPVLGWFEAPSPAALDGGADDTPDAEQSVDSLWIVQRWETLRTLAEYPAAPQAAAAAAATAWWPPVQRVAETPAARRARFVATAAARAVAALAYCHARRVAHGALDARVLLLSTVDDAAPGGPRVRLANFGFAVVGAASSVAADAEATEAAAAALAEAAHGDCRALGLAIAELVFAALSLEGPSERTSAAALGRLMLDVFAGDVAAAAAFAQEEPSWAPPCALLAAGQGAGWALVAELIDARTYSADADEVTAAADAFLQVVRVE